MRIVIDLQGAQTESRFRGIGRYAMSFTKAVLRNRGEHEVFVLLNGLFPETIEPIRIELAGLLPSGNIRVWHVPGPVSDMWDGNDRRREFAEYMRETFIASLHPDLVHVTSLFEGYSDDAVVSIGRFDRSVPVSVAFYDLIPFRNPEHYLKANWPYELYYKRKLASLERAGLLLAISESARHEALDNLHWPPHRVVNVSSAVEPAFCPGQEDPSVLSGLRGRIGLERPFVFYSGGADTRKNLFGLIEAFALLPGDVRSQHQLVLAGKIPEGNVAPLNEHALSLGLQLGDVLFTGYVTDEELIHLYYACRLYVFPSWDEGFGLPALEAMACGAPVIGANTTSVPEVIQWDEALFDPFSVPEIMKKMHRALADEKFRDALIDNGLRHAPFFSWDETARRALTAWEDLHLWRDVATGQALSSFGHTHALEALARARGNPDDFLGDGLANCLALNRQAGIERQLLVDVSELCQRDSASGVQRVVRSYLQGLLAHPPAGFRVEPVYATRDAGYRYARQFVRRFLGQPAQTLIDEPVLYGRGDIFFGLDLQHHVQLAHADFFACLRANGVTVKFLVYDLLPIQLSDLFKDSDARALHEQLMTLVASTDGAICISRATQEALDAWIVKHEITTSPNFQSTWVHIGGDIEGSCPSQGLPENSAQVLERLSSRPCFLCVSTLEPRKGQQQVLDAFELLWQQGVEANLVFVGKQGWKIDVLAERILAHKELGQRLFWFEGISDEYLAKVYESSSCLIAASLNEGFGLSVIEAARYGKPVIARDIPVFREVAGDYADYFTGFAASDLAQAVSVWLHHAAQTAPLPRAPLAWLTWQESTEKLKHALVDHNYPCRQLLVDVSELVERDAATGIQRVVRSILQEWLNHPPEGYRVEPVYATAVNGYRYARRFMQSFQGAAGPICTDDPIIYAPGDLFFVLDLQPQVQVAQRAAYQAMRRQGLKVMFMVYDLLCVRMPQFFPIGNEQGFADWLGVVAENDGAICISETVARDLKLWVDENHPQRSQRLTIRSSPLGADIMPASQPRSLPDGAAEVMARMGERPSFLMVGTLEPRKGHEAVLFAFERLWREGHDINLVIVGKQGWMVESLAACLQSHPELNRRLFWLQGVHDAYLEKIYQASTCLIAASYGEGYGLPLIEAAQRGVPIIARDIPVFREVCGIHAHYFACQSAAWLAEAVSDWLALFAQGRHPRPNGIKCVSWQASTRQALAMLGVGQHL
jgi:glycosyltransferase involved in cell wall biosynthesis